jgi:Ca-activated chloride channel homolog
MTVRLLPLPSTDYEPASEGAGLGTLRTDRGNLPLETIDVDVAITGLTARVQLRQDFHNPHGVPLEATYIFPLPDRAAVTAMRMEADGRVVDAVLKERGQARADYRQAIREGRRASIAEEERPDVFTMRVGNIMPGERVTVRLTLAQPLPYADGAATFRFPLVVAPRYVPGDALDGEPVGSGWTPDTDAVPDASRITPPVLLPGFPHPVALSIGVEVDPGGLPLSGMRSSLHAVQTEGRHLSIRPGERADRDFVLRLSYSEPGGEPGANAEALVLTPDAAHDTAGSDEGTFQLTVLPPTTAVPARPRDVVLVLDRSGSMSGWKIVAARRAAARIVDTLTDDDRFAVLAFDNTIERPAGLPSGLVAAADRNRYRAVEHLAGMKARGGTEMLAPLTEAISLLGTGEAGRDRVLVLITDGQVGNEDQILSSLSASLADIRVHTIGIDRAVNAGFLTRLAVIGGGRCELVESEDRLDEAAAHIHRRICAPLVTDLRLHSDGLTLVDDTVAPARLPDLVPGVPLVITGRWRGSPAGELTLSGRTAADEGWTARLAAVRADAPALGPIWARAHLRDLEDRYLAADRTVTAELERRIVETSLRFGVLCRFTAYVAIDSRVVTDGGEPHQVIQPVEPASGWEMLAGSGPPVRLTAHQARPSGLNAADVAITDSFVLGSGPVAAGPAAFAGPGPTPTAFAGPSPAAFARPAPATPNVRFSPTPLPPLLPDPDPLGWARRQAVDELRRLHEVAGQPLADRRTLLADLGSRLGALVFALTRQGVPATHTDPLRQLADALRAVHIGTVDQLWQRATTVLGTFAAHAVPPSPPSPARPRGDFWKR